MAKKYTATVQLHCWKQHDCSVCGTQYAYILDRKIAGTGPSAQAAQNALQKNFAKAQREANDMQPCPSCGHYQQDMIGSRLASRRAWLLLPAIAVPILIVILYATNVVQANTLTWVTAIYCLAVIALQLLLGASNPNANRDANRQLAAQRVNADTVQIRDLQNANNPALAPLPKPSHFLFHKIALACLLVAVLLAALPEIVRSASRWPLNAETFPPVLGPGDTARIYMTDTITSVKSYWRGSPSVLLTDPATGKTAPANATTNQNDWGDTISAKSDEKDNSSTPWIELTLPADTDFPQHNVACRIDLNIEYPHMAGTSTFEVLKQHMNRDLTLHLAPPGAGARYASTWWIATLAASAAVFLASLLLLLNANRYRRQAKPTHVFPIEPPAPQPAPPPANP